MGVIDGAALDSWTSYLYVGDIEVAFNPSYYDDAPVDRFGAQLQWSEFDHTTQDGFRLGVPFVFVGTVGPDVQRGYINGVLDKVARTVRAVEVAERP